MDHLSLRLEKDTTTLSRSMPTLLFLFFLPPLLFILNCIYNCFLHPLRRFPGPWYTRASRLPFLYYQTTGMLPQAIKALHDKFGDTVRIAPNDLSYTQSQAWFDIHGHQTGSRSGWFERDPSIYPELPGRAPSILLSNENDHRRFRRLLSHAFSEKALREQEPLILGHVQTLVKKLHEQISSKSKGVINISDWLNFTTFDIIGELSFGEPFGCLRAGEMHPWVKIMFSSLRDIVYLAALSHLPGFIFRPLVGLLNHIMMADLHKDKDFAADKVEARLSQSSTKSDFITPILRANDEKGMTVPEIKSSFNIIIVAGSETTATLLSGALYLLATHPQAKQSLTKELTTELQDKDNITMSGVQYLPYLNAVLEECLRMYPPSAFNQARVVPEGGASICGEWIPGGTAVGVGTLAAAWSKHNWSRAGEFVPERWLDDGWQEDDQRSVQPFLTGPRNCIGRNLAYAEMRLILTHILLHFDYELCEESLGWLDNQRFYLLWERPPLMLKFKEITA